MSTHDEASVRAEARAWLQQHWDIERSLVAWRNLLADAGWGMPHWPRAWYGRDLPVALLPVVEEEFEACGAVGVARGSASVCWRRRPCSNTARTIINHASCAAS